VIFAVFTKVCVFFYHFAVISTVPNCDYSVSCCPVITKVIVNHVKSLRGTCNILTFIQYQSMSLFDFPHCSLYDE